MRMIYNVVYHQLLIDKILGIIVILIVFFPEHTHFFSKMTFKTLFMLKSKSCVNQTPVYWL